MRLIRSISGPAGLSEHHAPGAMLGETFGTIIEHQFEALRDGDQFYFENQLDAATVAMVKSTTLSDIMERDTDTEVFQADSFLTAERHTAGVKPEDPNGAQLIIGTDGRAALRGGVGDDTLVAHSGTQVLTGGGGNDTFVFEFGKQLRTPV